MRDNKESKKLTLAGCKILDYYMIRPFVYDLLNIVQVTEIAIGGRI